MKRLLCVMACAILLTGCGKGEVTETIVEIDEMAVESSETTAESNETTVNEEITGDIYNPIIAGLSEEDAYAIIENDAKYPILLVSSGVYDDGMGNWAALESDVYYVIDDEVKNVGSLISGGTAYPISYNQTGFYAANGHYVEYYEISEEHGRLVSKEMYLEMFDENGTATYMKVIDGVESESTEEELTAAFEEFSNATVVNYNRLTEQAETVNTCDEAERKTLSQGVVITQTDSDGGKSVSEYDETGKLITFMDYNDDGSLWSWDEYEYDNLGNITKNTEYNEEGDITCWYEYEYDSMGNKVKTVQYAADFGVTVREEYEYEYDHMGNQTKVVQYGLGGVVYALEEYKYEYDSQGNVIKRTYSNEDGSVVIESEYDCFGNEMKHVSYQDGSILYWDEYEYDSQGNRTKRVGLNLDGVITSTEYEYDSMGNETNWIDYNEDGSMRLRIEHEYDSLGNETKSTRYNGDGSIDRWSTYEYEYDNQGNITKSVYNINGSFSEWKEYTYDFRGVTSQHIVFNEDNGGIQALE